MVIRIHKLVVVLFLLCAGSSAALADNDNVQVLLRKCTSKGSADQLYCIGRVTGIFEMMGLIGVRAGKQLASMEPLEICSDPMPSNGAVIQAFTNWANKHPEKWNAPDIAGIVIAVHETWRCP